MLYVKQVC